MFVDTFFQRELRRKLKHVTFYIFWRIIELLGDVSSEWTCYSFGQITMFWGSLAVQNATSSSCFAKRITEHTLLCPHRQGRGGERGGNFPWALFTPYLNILTHQRPSHYHITAIFTFLHFTLNFKNQFVVLRKTPPQMLFFSHFMQQSTGLMDKESTGMRK